MNSHTHSNPPLEDVTTWAQMIIYNHESIVKIFIGLFSSPGIYILHYAEKISLQMGVIFHASNFHPDN